MRFINVILTFNHIGIDVIYCFILNLNQNLVNEDNEFFFALVHFDLTIKGKIIFIDRKID